MKAKDVLKQLYLLIHVNVPLWILSVIGATITSLPWFLSLFSISLITKYSLDYAVENKAILTIGILIVLFNIFLRIPTILGYALNSWASEKLSGLIQKQLMNHWIYRDLSADTPYKTSDIMTRLTNDCCDCLSEFYFQGFGLKIIEPILTGSMAMIVLFMIDVRFLLICLSVGILSTIITLFFTKKITVLQHKKQTFNTELTNIFSDSMHNMVSIKTRNLDKFVQDKFTLRNREIRKVSTHIEYIESFTSSISLIADLLILIICFFVGLQLPNFEFSSIIVILQMQFFVNNLLSNIGYMWNYLVKIAVSSQRIFDLLEDLTQTKQESSQNMPSSISTLCIKDLCFSYEDKKVLRHLSLIAKKGEIIAIAGDSGSGKTTLFNIMQGFLKNYTGMIELDEINMRLYQSKNLMQIVKSFPQEAVLFHTSIKENIQISNASPISDQQIEKLCEEMNLTSFIESFPDGLHTVINENASNLSGGEKQKIALLRLYFLKAPIILLDEPTSALDLKSEELFCNLLSKIKHDKIILINTHRSKIFEIATRVYTLDNGVLKII